MVDGASAGPLAQVRCQLGTFLHATNSLSVFRKLTKLGEAFSDRRICGGIFAAHSCFAEPISIYEP